MAAMARCNYGRSLDYVTMTTIGIVARNRVRQVNRVSIFYRFYLDTDHEVRYTAPSATSRLSVYHWTSSDEGG